MTSVQIAEALLDLEGAAALAALHRPGHKCDEVPVRAVMVKMFPDTSNDELAMGLELAITMAELDEAEAEALGDWRPSR